MATEKIYAPLAYLITFTTYGSWLHGSAEGSIWKNKKENTTVLIGEEQALNQSETARLKHPPFHLDDQQRQQVLESLLEVCRHRNWDAYAVHVRFNHVHAVISAHAKPEKIMNDFKSYATRRLKDGYKNILPGKLWTRHGSTRYLWQENELTDAVNYVCHGQGHIMALGQTISQTNTLSNSPSNAHRDHYPSPDREGGDR